MGIADDDMGDRDERPPNAFGNPTAATFPKHVISAGKVVTDSTLPAATQQLVALRAGQINGCGFCVDMHRLDVITRQPAGDYRPGPFGWPEQSAMRVPARSAPPVLGAGSSVM